MTSREIVRIKNGWTVVSSRKDEASYRYASKALAERHKAGLERLDVARAEHVAYTRQCRLEAAQRYLEQRAERPKRPSQLELF